MAEKGQIYENDVTDGQGFERFLEQIDGSTKQDKDFSTGKSWKPTISNADICKRCGKKVYTVEKVKVTDDVCYHKGCFKCCICGASLTLKAFYRDLDRNSKDTKEIYCKKHVPKAKGKINIDALGIKSPLESQKHKKMEARKTVQEGWNFNPLGELNIDQEYPGDSALLEPYLQPDDPTSDLGNLRLENDRKHPRKSTQKEKNPYDPSPLERLPSVSEDNFGKNFKPKRLGKDRRSTLNSFNAITKDFEKYGIFSAQAALEEIHRKEEDELYRQIFAEREEQMSLIRATVEQEKEKTVMELIRWFETRGASPEEQQEGFNKVERYYARLVEERIRVLLARLSQEEQAAAARMVGKHSKEMLLLIAEKEKQAEAERKTEKQNQQNERLENKRREVEDTEPVHEDNTYDVIPPDNSKSDLYSDPVIFTEMDNQAIEEAKREHTTFTDLVRKLSKRCHTELHKARAIFRWVTAKDLNKMRFDEQIDIDSPLGLLRGIKQGTESYHDLFKRLCSYAGLHCEVIDGYSKGAGYRPGTAIKGQMFRNQWTAVNIDGNWRFINCNWGARHVKAVMTSQLTYKCDEFYFLTDPEEHIYQHLPDDPAWQLLSNPYSISEFVDLPVLKSPFFTGGFVLSGHYSAILNADNGHTELRIFTGPQLVSIAARLEATNGQARPEELKERVFVRFIDNEVSIFVNLPSPGHYYLDVYVGQEWGSDCMDNACSFGIFCTSVSLTGADITYPQVGCFGRTPHMKAMGITEAALADPYVACHGDVKIGFTLTKDINMWHALKKWEPRGRLLIDYDKFAFLKHRLENFAAYIIAPPERGYYVFSVFASDPDGERKDLRVVFRYLLDARTPARGAHGFPKASRRWKLVTLRAPMRGELVARAHQPFSLESNAVQEMMVMVGEKSTSLECKGGLWEGLVYAGDSGKLILYGRFDPDKAKYIPLLEYNVTES